MSEHTPGLSYSALGAQLGISKQMVGKLKKSGMPVDSVEAARAWRQAHLDAGRDKSMRMSIADPGLAADAPAEPREAPAPDKPVEVDESSEDYRRDRARNERIKADSAQLELDQLRGRLIGLDDAKRLAFTAFRSLRDAVLNVPARVKDQCAAQTDALVIEQLIENELRGALESLDPDRVLTETEAEADDDETD